MYLLKLYFSEKKKKYFLHVRFFNDKGRRSWTSITENYCGKAELLSKYPDSLVSINSIMYFNKFYISKCLY